MTRVRLGLIGCGGISHSHLMRFLLIPEVEIPAVCDVNESNIKKLKDSFPTLLRRSRSLSDYVSMLNDVRLDAVAILTPHMQHFEQAIESLGKGLHVLIEKPMVCTVEQGEKLINRYEEMKKVVVVAYQRRYQPQFRFIKGLIEAGTLGDLQFISAMQCQDWFHLTMGTWRQDPKMSGGGQLIDSASHLFDMILWTTGLEPIEVSAFTNNLETSVDIDSSINIRFRNNAQASIGIIGNSPIWEENIGIWGEKGVIFYKNGRLEYLLFKEGEGQRQAYSSGRQADTRIEPLKLPKGSDPNRNFINTILGREENESPPRDGLRVIKLTEAIWESSRKGEITKVDI